EESGKFQLLRGADEGKDQSYFLHRLTQDDLSRAIFPVGDFKKSEVREIAQKFNLPVAQKHDSQGLCFIGDISIPEFLSRFIPLKEGPVMDKERKEVGTHAGAALYTLGQRHGFETSSTEPYFVTKIDTTSNTIYVSHERDDAATKSAHVSDLHWIGKPL